MSRAYVELISGAVLRGLEAAREAGGAIGVRLSPVDLVAAEAGPLAAALQAALGPVDRVAVAAPGAASEEGPGWLVGGGDEVAQRATLWRNTVQPGGLVVYVSAERLGRAGGLEDTLRPVTDAELSAALSGALAGAGLPDELVGALTSLDLLGADRPRLAARFLEAAAGADVAACGALLPLIGLMPDSALDASVHARLEHNKRVVDLARDGRRPQGEGPTAELRRALAEPIRRRGLAGVEEVDLGRYGLADLEQDRPKAAPRRARLPTLAAPAARPAARPPRQSAPAEVKVKRAQPAPAGGAPGAGAAPEPAATPTTTPQAGALGAPEDAVTAPPADHGRAPDGGEDDGARDAAPQDEGDEPDPAAPEEGGAGEASTSASADPDDGAAPPAAQDDGAAAQDELGDGVALSAAAVVADNGGATTARPRASRARRSPPAPWTADLQRAERPARPAAPAGLVELLAAGLAAGGDGLEWYCAGAPGALVAALPRGLRPADRRAANPSATWDQWLEARAALVAAAAAAHRPGAEAPDLGGLIQALIDAPQTILGAPDVAEAAVRAAELGRLVLVEARAAGRASWAMALRMETATLRSASGEELVALGPLHPLLLSQALERLDAAARASRLPAGASRAALAAWADRPPAVPVEWDGGLPFVGGPRWAPCFGAALPPGAGLEVALPALIGTYLSVHPHAALALRVGAEEAAAEVAEAVALALAASPAGLLASAAVEGAALRGAALAEAAAERVRLEPASDARERHIDLRRAAPGAAAELEAPACVGELCLGPWRAGSVAATPLAEACLPLPVSGRTWLAVLGRQLTGPPPARWFVIARAGCGPDELVVLTREIDALAEHLRDAMGVPAGRDRQARLRLQELCASNLGVVALDGAGGPALSAGIAAIEALEQLGEDAHLLHVDDELRAVLFAGVRGALAVATKPTKQGPKFAFGAHDAKLAKERWASAALARAEEIATLAGTRGLVGEAAASCLRAASSTR